MQQKLDLTMYEFAKGRALSITAKADFGAGLFSKRELRLLESLATEFRDSSADDMIEATHLENQPWDKVFNVQGKRQANIPYELASRVAEVEQIEALHSEQSEMRRNFSDL